MFYYDINMLVFYVKVLPMWSSHVSLNLSERHECIVPIPAHISLHNCPPTDIYINLTLGTPSTRAFVSLPVFRLHYVFNRLAE